MTNGKHFITFLLANEANQSVSKKLAIARSISKCRIQLMAANTLNCLIKEQHLSDCDDDLASTHILSIMHDLILW